MIDKSLIDYRVYLVLDPDLCADFGMVETAVAAAQAGAGLVQLRAPGWKKKAMYECALALKEKLAALNVPLIIDDHVDVAMAVQADGIHVGQKDLPVDVVRKLVGPDMIVGLSINSLDELKQMDPDRVDYIGVGPVFRTSTKKDAASPIGLKGLEAIVRASLVPAVGIGGIKACHMGEVAATGAKGAAVVSAICGTRDPALATEALLSAWQAR